MRWRSPPSRRFFFFNDTATTEIYTLSLHDALPIFNDDIRAGDIGSLVRQQKPNYVRYFIRCSKPTQRYIADYLSDTLGSKPPHHVGVNESDRKSTRLNSSHDQISYAVFCLKKKTHHASPRRAATGSRRSPWPGTRQRPASPRWRRGRPAARRRPPTRCPWCRTDTVCRTVGR